MSESPIDEMYSKLDQSFGPKSTDNKTQTNMNDKWDTDIGEINKPNIQWYVNGKLSKDPPRFPTIHDYLQKISSFILLPSMIIKKFGFNVPWVNIDYDCGQDIGTMFSFACYQIFFVLWCQSSFNPSINIIALFFCFFVPIFWYGINKTNNVTKT